MNWAALAMWKRRVALVILTWAILDLSVPGLCPGEREMPPASTVAVALSLRQFRTTSKCAIPVQTKQLMTTVGAVRLM